MIKGGKKIIEQEVGQSFTVELPTEEGGVDRWIATNFITELPRN